MDLFRFEIGFLTKEEDWDEVEGVIDFNERKVDLIENGKWKGFIPFSSIKKLEVKEKIGSFS